MFETLNKKNNTIETQEDQQYKDLVSKNNECSEIIRQLMTQKTELTEQLSQLANISKEKKELLERLDLLLHENQELKQKISEYENLENNQITQIHDISKLILDARAFADKIIDDAKKETANLKNQAAFEADLLKQQTAVQIEEMKRSSVTEIAKMIEYAKTVRSMTALLKQQNDCTLDKLLKAYNEADFISLQQE